MGAVREQDFTFSTRNLMSLIPLYDGAYPDADGETAWGGKGRADETLDSLIGDLLPDFNMAKMTVNQVNATLIGLNFEPLDFDFYRGKCGYAIRVNDKYFISPGKSKGKPFFKASQFHMCKPVLSLPGCESPIDFWTGKDLAKIILEADPHICRDAIVYLAQELWKACKVGDHPQIVADKAAAKGWLKDFRYGTMPESYNELFV